MNNRSAKYQDQKTEAKQNTVRINGFAFSIFILFTVLSGLSVAIMSTANMSDTSIALVAIGLLLIGIYILFALKVALPVIVNIVGSSGALIEQSIPKAADQAKPATRRMGGENPAGLWALSLFHPFEETHEFSRTVSRGVKGSDRQAIGLMLGGSAITVDDQCLKDVIDRPFEEMNQRVEFRTRV